MTGKLKIFDGTPIDAQWLTSVRRQFHRIPEPSSNETKTFELITSILNDMGLTNYRQIGKTGLTVDIGSGNSPVIAVRADIDALPIDEKPSKLNSPYISLHKGMMHGCGHDAHIAIALSTAKTVYENTKGGKSLNGTVRFIFQPAEETGSGAVMMLKHNVLDSPAVEKLVALHVDPSLATGQIGIRKGVAYAACDIFRISIEGKDGHGSQPHNVQDPITAGAYLVTQLQTIVSRNLNPLRAGVVSIGSFIGGNRFNIIPESVRIEGTVRSLDKNTRDLLQSRITDMCDTLARTFNIRSCTLKYTRETPVGYNNPELACEITDVAADLFGTENIVSPDPSMGAEDFAFYTRDLNDDKRENAPLSCYMRLGVAPFTDTESIATRPGLHNAAFDIDEKALPIGVKLFLGIIENSLYRKKEV